MIEILKRYNDKTFDVVCEKEVSIGDEFVVGYNPVEKKEIKQIVAKIYEQRKEKGVYNDESKRRIWAKIS